VRRDGRYVVRASFRDLRAWEIGDVEIGLDRAVHLNLLLPATAVAPAGSVPAAAADGRVLVPACRKSHAGDVAGRAVTLRTAAIAVGAVAFLLGAA
jgi:hypothetical protein